MDRPPDRHAGDRARVELDYEHASARLLRILQHIGRYSPEQIEAATATYGRALAARRDAYKEWYREVEEWSDRMSAS